MTLIYLGSAWIVGILLASVLTLPPLFLLVGLIPLPLLLFLRRHRRLVLLASLCLLALAGGLVRYQPGSPGADEKLLYFYNGRDTLEIRGVVATDPDIRDRTTQLRLSAREIKAHGQWQTVTGTALLFVPPYPAYSYGDVLRVTGQLTNPPRFDDFDYAGYLAHEDIYSTMLYPGVEILDTDQGSALLSWVYAARQRLSGALAEVLPEPQASLAQGVVLGMRGHIPPSLRTDFSRSGTAHLLAISGLHLSIVTGMLLGICRRVFGRRHHTYAWLTLGAVWLYALITGMNPPVIRAAIMASLFLVAAMLGRQRSAVTALVFAAAVMVGVSPQLLWQASFQLSFLAMVGLFFISPRLQSWSRDAVTARLGEVGATSAVARYVTDMLSLTLGVLMVVWPVIAYHFGIISLVAPLATFLALPALPGIIVTGALAAGLGVIALPVAQVVGWVAWLFASYMLAVVSGTASLPWSFVESGALEVRLVWGYYLMLAAAVWLAAYRRRLPDVVPSAAGYVSRLPKKWLLPPLLIAAILTNVAAATMPDGNLHVSFLDVGQGDAILIQTPARQDILVDGGPSPTELGVALGRKMPFWDRTIDLVVMTHPHADHSTGLLEVLRRYRVKQVLFYPAPDYESPLYDEWLGLIEEEGIAFTLARAGQRIDLGDGAVIEVLNPPVPPLLGTESDTDNNAVVIRLNLGRMSFLLTADIAVEAESELLRRRANLRSTVLKVGHHGSDTSTSQQFLATVAPLAAAVQVGADNRFGHPSEEVMERLAEEVGPENTYRTDEHGTVEFITDGQRLWVRTER